MDVNGFIINPQSGSAGVHDIDFSVAAVNEGIDKEVIVEGVCGDKSAPLHLIHEGLRQPFGLSGGGIFRLANGGRFGVLKGVEKALVYISNSTLIQNGTLLRNF